MNLFRKRALLATSFLLSIFAIATYLQAQNQDANEEHDLIDVIPIRQNKNEPLIRDVSLRTPLRERSFQFRTNEEANNSPAAIAASRLTGIRSAISVLRNNEDQNAKIDAAKKIAGLFPISKEIITVPRELVDQEAKLVVELADMFNASYLNSHGPKSIESPEARFYVIKSIEQNIVMLNRSQFSQVEETLQTTRHLEQEYPNFHHQVLGVIESSLVEIEILRNRLRASEIEAQLQHHRRNWSNADARLNSMAAFWKKTSNDRCSDTWAD